MQSLSQHSLLQWTSQEVTGDKSGDIICYMTLVNDKVIVARVNLLLFDYIILIIMMMMMMTMTMTMMMTMTMTTTMVMMMIKIPKMEFEQI